MNPEESGGIRRNPNPKKSYANTGIPVPQKFLRKIPVNAAENRNFQDPSKITFLERSSSGNNREKKKSLGILAGIGFWELKNEFLKTGT